MDAFLLKALLDDFQATGKCNMKLGKNELFLIETAWAIAKKSPYTSYINHGYTGLLRYICCINILEIFFSF